MNASSAVALLFSMALSAQAAPVADELPISFGRSGGTVWIRLAASGAEPSDEVMLEAFGRRWAGPAVPAGGIVIIDVPAVRVPTVFRVVTHQEPGTFLGELVAYPPHYTLKWETDREATWPDQTPAIVSMGAPAWLCQWIRAVGLPLEMATAASYRKRPVDRRSTGGLLILGRSTACQSVADVARLLEQARHAARRQRRIHRHPCRGAGHQRFRRQRGDGAPLHPRDGR